MTLTDPHVCGQASGEREVKPRFAATGRPLTSHGDTLDTRATIRFA